MLHGGCSEANGVGLCTCRLAPKGRTMNNPLSPEAFTAFFDIREPLGSTRFSPRRPQRLERLDIYLQTPEVLQMERFQEAAGPGFEPGLSDSEAAPIGSWPVRAVA